MAKLDRLVWAGEIAFVVQGVRVGLRANRAELLPTLRAMFPPGAREIEPGRVEQLYSVIAGQDRGTIRGFNLGYANSNRLARTHSLDEVLRQVENDMHLAVAAYSRGHVFVHAGVVGWRGRAVLIPGSSCSGKTELTAALLHAGATYYSDEYALLDGHGRVHPYPIDLARRSNGPAEPPVPVAAQSFGATIATEPVPVGLILSTRFRPQARWQPRTLSPGLALMRILRSTVSARMQPKRSMAALSRVVAKAPLWIGPRGDVSDFVPELVSKMEQLWA